MIIYYVVMSLCIIYFGGMILFPPIVWILLGWGVYAHDEPLGKSLDVAALALFACFTWPGVVYSILRDTYIYDFREKHETSELQAEQ